MIQEKETIEQPGKNAIEHPCQMRVEIPGDDGEASTFKKCLLTSLLQCLSCAAWICGTEELEHCNICVRCDMPFCPECYRIHRLENRCQPEVA